MKVPDVRGVVAEDKQGEMTAAEEVEQPHVLPSHRCAGRARRGARSPRRWR